MIRRDIDCIVHQEGTTPQVFHFDPDPNFPFIEEDKMKPKNLEKILQPKITILNYKDNHFNIMVVKNTMLAVSGSFSFQREAAKTDKSETKVIKCDTTSEIDLKRKIEELEITLKMVLNENEN